MYTYLKLHGVQPWLDREDLLPGQDWEVEIPKAIFTSDVILVCLSKNSVNKEGYVQKEIAFALDKALEKPQGTIFIIPIKLEECDVPDRLKRYQWVDYFRTDGRKRLLMGLNQRALGLGEELLPLIFDDARKPKSLPKSEIIGEMADKTLDIDRSAFDDAKKTIQEVAEVVGDEMVKQELVEKSGDGKSPDEKERIDIITIDRQNRNVRSVGFAWSIILLLVLGGIGLNSVFNQPPEGSTNTPSYTITQTPKPLTETSIPKTFIATLDVTETVVPPQILDIGSTMISEKDGMVMVHVPAGEFTMGSISNSDEQPEHQVYLDAFWVDQTEVINAMYAQCVEDGDCTPPDSVKSYTHESYYGNSEFDNYPVIYVDWNQANEYCSWAGRRLPTEAEWEKAARGTDGRAYPWGENISCDYANYSDGNKYCVGDTSAVGSYLDGASPYGALDMTGNAWEWVSSLYQDYPYDATDGREDLMASGSRVLRGGSWFNFNIYLLRSAYRLRIDPSNTLNNIGFRCSLSHP
jgi:formylglycine-generating enzyme required for sulfatase activity